MFVDASVIVAILTNEERSSNCLAALDTHASMPRITNVLAVWETASGLLRKKQIPILKANDAIANFLLAADITVVGIGDAHRAAALLAFERYGRHNYGDADRNRALNMADCFHYAVARVMDLPMLSLDAGFAATDIATVDIA